MATNDENIYKQTYNLNNKEYVIGSTKKIIQNWKKFHPDKTISECVDELKKYDITESEVLLYWDNDYGLSEEGIKIKRLQNIIDEIHSDLTKSWGINTKQNPQSYLNVLITGFADRIAELWEIGQEVYYSAFPLTAEGMYLDNDGQYAGLYRSDGKPSQYYVLVHGKLGNNNTPIDIPVSTIASTKDAYQPVTYLDIAKAYKLSLNNVNEIKLKFAGTGYFDSITTDEEYEPTINITINGRIDADGKIMSRGEKFTVDGKEPFQQDTDAVIDVDENYSKYFSSYKKEDGSFNGYISDDDKLDECYNNFLNGIKEEEEKNNSENKEEVIDENNIGGDKQENPFIIYFEGDTYNIYEDYVEIISYEYELPVGISYIKTVKHMHHEHNIINTITGYTDGTEEETSVIEEFDEEKESFNISIKPTSFNSDDNGDYVESYTEIKINGKTMNVYSVDVNVYKEYSNITIHVAPENNENVSEGYSIVSKTIQVNKKYYRWYTVKTDVLENGKTNTDILLEFDYKLNSSGERNVIYSRQTSSTYNEQTASYIFSSLAEKINANGLGSDYFTAKCSYENGVNYLTLTSKYPTANHKISISKWLTPERVGMICLFNTQDNGDIFLPNGTITTVVGNGPYIESEVTNVGSYIPGKVTDTDEEFRKSYIDRIFVHSSRMCESIKSAILNNCSNIISCAVYENCTNFTDEDGRPPHSVEAVVQGGSEEEIALQIYNTKAAGINTYGSIGMMISDKDQEIPIYFNRPEKLYIHFDVTVSPLDNSGDSGIGSSYEDNSGSGWQGVVQKIITSAVNSLSAGDEVVPQTLFVNEIYNKVYGIDYIDVQMWSEEDYEYEITYDKIGLNSEKVYKYDENGNRILSEKHKNLYTTYKQIPVTNESYIKVQTENETKDQASEIKVYFKVVVYTDNGKEEDLKINSDKFGKTSTEIITNIITTFVSRLNTGDSVTPQSLFVSKIFSNISNINYIDVRVWTENDYEYSIIYDDFGEEVSRVLKTDDDGNYILKKIRKNIYIQYNEIAVTDESLISVVFEKEDDD